MSLLFQRNILSPFSRAEVMMWGSGGIYVGLEEGRLRCDYPTPSAFYMAPERRRATSFNN
jgi:hypothetical protein